MAASKKKIGRDIIIIAVVLAVAVTGYFVLSQKPRMAKTGFQHPDIPGIDMSVTPEMEQIISELPDDYEALVKLGNDYMDHGVYALAIECYQRAIDIDSSSADVLIDLGVCRYAVGEGEKAIELFEKALAMKPDQIIGYFNMGIVYKSLGNTDKAVQYWKKIIELEPDSPMADTVRGYIDKLSQQEDTIQ